MRKIARSGREATIAGARPKISPAANDNPMLKSRMLTSICTAPARGRSGGATDISARTPHDPSSSPAAPPRSESTTLSASSWRIKRARPAPSAARTAISPVRVVARASRRFDTLTQAISITKPTAPKRIHSGR